MPTTGTTTATTTPASPARPVTRQILVFSAVGVVNTGTYYGSYLLLLTRLPYFAAHLLGFLISMTGSFFLNARFTYRTRPTWRKFLLFPLTNATNLTLTTTALYLIVHVAHSGNHLAPLLASGAALPATFLISRMIMLPKHARHAPPPAPAPAPASARGTTSRPPRAG
jgi:putative flippase GtrA